MPIQDSITIPKHVLSESLNDETVLLNLDTGMYFGLSPVATRFWKLLGEGLTREQSQTLLLDEFDVEAAALNADLDSLLDELEARKLILRQTS